jgi:hypothetical protein
MEQEAGVRACLHCALGRALRAESKMLSAHGIEVRLSFPDPILLPTRGARVYRVLRRLLRQAATAAGTPGALKVAVIALRGKSHAEVTATFSTGRGARVTSATFPLFVPGTLAGGFAEALDVG